MIKIKVRKNKKDRKSFKQILVKRLISTLLITTIIVLLVTVVALQVGLYTYNSMYFMEESYGNNAVNNVYETIVKNGTDINTVEGKTEFYNRLKFYFAPSRHSHWGTAFLDGETLETIWNGEEEVIALVAEKNTTNNKAKCYKLDGAVPDEYRELYWYIDSKYLYGELLYEPYEELAGIYVKDNKFQLGKVIVHDYNKRGKETITEYDFTPSDTEGYTYLENDDSINVMVTSVVGVETDTAIYKKLQQYVNEIQRSGSENVYYTSEFMGLWDMELMSNSRINLPDGTNILVCRVMSVNLLETYGKYILIAYLIIYTVVILLTALFARMKYLKLKAGYDMEDYRITMTNTMAHDLKSPLMAISGYAENLKANINTDKKDYYADSILDNVTYMNDIIANVLELSKVENGNVELRLTDIAVEKLVSQVAEHYKDSLEDKKLNLSITGTATIKADQSLMQQVMDNLLGNAVKYSREGTTIEVVFEQRLNKKTITLTNYSTEDVGKNASNLWKPFVKGDNSRSNKQGTGVGLSIVKNILDLHGYNMQITCEEGKFKVEIQAA